MFHVDTVNLENYEERFTFDNINDTMRFVKECVLFGVKVTVTKGE